ncbi:hypothetical protein ACHAW6_014093 [Cyclotella cf. meneghiniana]
MVQYKSAALTLLLSSTSSAIHLGSNSCALLFPHPTRHTHKRIQSVHSSSNSRRYSAVPYDDRHSSASSEQPPTPGAAMQLVESQIDSLLPNPVDDDEAVESLLAKKEERIQARRNSQQTNYFRPYRVTLPIIRASPQQSAQRTGDVNGQEKSEEALASLVAKGQEIALQNTVGMSLRQVYAGKRLSELALDVDTLRFQSFVDELQGRTVLESEGENGERNQNLSGGAIQVLQNSALETIKDTFDGVLVSSVAKGGLAWEAGVRAGDVLIATSATIGNKLWPKSTLDGVRSAISSRKVLSPTMDFEFRRLGVHEGTEQLNNINSFELTLSRPIGINVEDTDDGYVTITGISSKASSAVTDNLRVGDRVVSVESSLGNKMWQVYNTDGLISAVTSRLPGQSVRIGFERAEETNEAAADTTQFAISGLSSLPRDVLSDAVDGFRIAKEKVTTSTATSSQVLQQQALKSGNQSASQKMLLSRSRDLLRTYIARNEATAERAVPVKVADRVLEAVMEASAALDGRTLTLIMTAYNICDKSEKAIQTFEEVFGLSGDGSQKEVYKTHGGKLIADITALNVFSISALLRAHANRGDYESSMRVLAAMEGRADFSVNGRKALSWSGKGDPLNMLPDTRVYNIALAAAAKRGTKEGLLAAIEIFDSMPDPSLDNPPFGVPAKNLVTYNTMIDAYAIQGRYQDANDVFKALKKSKLRPDQITFTTLIKASIKGGSLDRALDLLDDMKWVGIQPDLVTYNSVIEALCNTNRLYEAKDLVNEMERTKVKPDSMTYVLLMKGLLKANKPGPCLTLFESAFADRRTTALTENVQLYTTAITAAAALGDHERALELVTRMNSAGVKPNKKTLTALMGACISGKQYDAAVDIYSKIKNPDSYAISVGLQALCYAGKFGAALELITDQKSGQKKLTGKQVMTGYNTLIMRTLEAGAFSDARNALTGLLSAGYIPSKTTYRSMLEGLNLRPDIATSRNRSNSKGSSQVPNATFQFLLFVLDSLENRKLTIDSSFYAATLILGAQNGALDKRIAYLMSQARRNGREKEISLPDHEATELVQTHIKWEDLLLNYSTYKEELGSKLQLPFIRVSSNDFGRVLAAEQAVTYQASGRR